MLGTGLHDIPPGKLSVIITYLEMRAPAAPRPAALPEGIAFRRVTPSIAWYRDIFRRVGSQDWLWVSRLRMPDPELAAVLADPKVQVWTLTANGRDEALLELDFRQDGACELAFFGVTPALIGTGAGRFLMNQAIALAWAEPISLFHVHTCTADSPQALSFYRRSGFVPIRQCVDIDDDPRISGELPDTAGPHMPIFRP